VARAAGVQVVHCTAYRRDDAKGANRNARLFAGVKRSPVGLLPGTPAVEVVADLGPEPEDLVLTRTHGLNPMGGTDLDPVLRNLGVTTLVATGVSVNIAVTNLVMDAVNLGYDVVLPRDAVAGLPWEYADAVIDNTLALLATVCTTADLLEVWG
jgi:nicotinamidase-related amidase